MSNNDMLLDGFFKLIIENNVKKIDKDSFNKEIKNLPTSRIKNIISRYEDPKSIKKIYSHLIEYNKLNASPKVDILLDYCSSLLQEKRQDTQKDVEGSQAIKDNLLYDEVSRLRRDYKDINTRLRMLAQDIPDSNLSRTLQECTEASDKALKAAQAASRSATEAQSAEESVILTKFEVENLEKRLEKIKEILDNYLSLSITIIGIFVAIIVVFFGSNTLISSIDNASEERDSMYFISVFVIGFIIINTVFLLCYLLSKLTNRSIGTVSKKCKIAFDDVKEVTDQNDICRQCPKNCGFWGKLLRRYSYIVFLNLFLLMAIFILKYDVIRVVIDYSKKFFMVSLMLF